MSETNLVEKITQIPKECPFTNMVIFAVAAQPENFRCFLYCNIETCNLKAEFLSN